MAEDLDEFDELTSAFAALERSRKRMDVIMEQAHGLDDPSKLAALLDALKLGKPLSDQERSAVAGYLNGLAIAARAAEPEEQRR